jgi:hypothetical protein
LNKIIFDEGIKEEIEDTKDKTNVCDSERGVAQRGK